jgi:hypothetical protein
MLLTNNAFSAKLFINVNVSSLNTFAVKVTPLSNIEITICTYNYIRDIIIVVISITIITITVIIIVTLTFVWNIRTVVLKKTYMLRPISTQENFPQKEIKFCKM